MKRMLFIATLSLLTACGNVAGAGSLSETGKCSYDTDCADDEVCRFPGTRDARCVILNCSNKAKARRHKCVCGKNELFIGNKCQRIDCSSDPDCADTDVCINPGTAAAACTVLNCPVDEKAQNHACVKKACADYDGRYKTDCAQTEIKTPVGNTGSDGDCFLCGMNAQCAAAADCPPDEACTDGKCVPLICPACQKPDGHQCIPVENCCETDNDCAFNGKCTAGECRLKTCAEINSSYKTVCQGNEKAEPTDIGGTDGKCLKCVLKKCAEIDPSYKTECHGKEFPLPRTTGADGLCFICRAPSCVAIDSAFRECFDNEKPVPTGIQGFEGECSKCVLKTCNELDPTYATACKETETALPANAWAADGKCFKCELKTCMQINPSYRARCEGNGRPRQTGFTGSDGECYVCEE